MDEDMEQLVDSIRRNGVITHATVRLKEDGRYELISGYRRKKACELAEELLQLRQQIKELEKENRRLKKENDFLEEASAFFAASRLKSAKTKE